MSTPKEVISETTVLKSNPENDPLLQTANITIQAEASPEEEYIPGQVWSVGQAVRTLPPYIDELERDFGLDIYDRMMDEPTINSQVGILVSAALGHDVDFSPIRDDKDPDYEDSVRMVRFVQENIERMEDTDFLPYLYEMGEGGFSHGHECSEAVYELAPSDVIKKGNEYYLWKRLKPKAQTSTSFVVDRSDNVLGYTHSAQNITSMWDIGLPQSFAMTPDEMSQAKILPQAKVPTFTYMMRKSDPRGKAGLRPAYHPWWMLQEAFDNARKFMRLFGVPPIWTTLPPNAVDQLLDPETKQPLAKANNAAKVQNDKAKAMRSNGIATFGYQATLNTIEPKSEGAFILNQIALNRVRIANAITFQELATSDTGGSSRALGAIHQDMFGIRVAFLRFRIAAFIRMKLIVPLIDLNFGKQYRYLAPRVTLGSVELNDLPSIGIMVARLLQAGAIKKDQLPEIYEILNLPQSEILKMEIEAAIKQLESGQLLDASGNPIVTVQGGQLQQGQGQKLGNSRGGQGQSAGSREDMTRQYGMPGNTN